MKFLIGSLAYNSHLQNIALALHEAHALGALQTGLVDNNYNFCMSKVRRFINLRMPKLDRQIIRRKITVLPESLIHKTLFWELFRTFFGKLRMSISIEDWFWERSEHSLDRKCSRLLKNSDFDAFLGVEHGSLEAIKTANRLGKKSVLVFQSPHHSFRKKWVDREQEKFPELFPSSSRRLLERGRLRDARRDEEASLADFIHANSNVTAASLIEAGIPEKKIKVLSLGTPPSIPDESLPTSLSTPLRFIYAGPISIRKGAHYLLKAWELLKPNRNAELHLYGVPLLPDSFLKNGAQNVIFHGSISQKELSMAYQQSAILVFPSLCDGFGLVASEAMANGLPVITTKNAGVADFIKEGFNGFVVSPANAESLAKRLEWCIKNPDELLRMRSNALISARRWTWNEFRAEFRHQISDLLGISL